MNEPFPHPRLKADPLYHRQWMLPENTAEADDGRQADAEADFDQTGYELPPWREPVTDLRQGSLFSDDCVQLEPPDDEPVFALPDCGSAPAEEDFIQADAPDRFGE